MSALKKSMTLVGAALVTMSVAAPAVAATPAGRPLVGSGCNQLACIKVWGDAKDGYHAVGYQKVTINGPHSGRMHLFGPGGLDAWGSWGTPATEKWGSGIGAGWVCSEWYRFGTNTMEGRACIKVK